MLLLLLPRPERALFELIQQRIQPLIVLKPAEAERASHNRQKFVALPRHRLNLHAQPNTHAFLHTAFLHTSTGKGQGCQQINGVHACIGWQQAMVLGTGCRASCARVHASDFVRTCRSAASAAASCPLPPASCVVTSRQPSSRQRQAAGATQAACTAEIQQQQAGEQTGKARLYAEPTGKIEVCCQHNSGCL